MDKSPDAFRTISEVASELGLAQHVLRFWESKFPQLRPLKRGGGRRFYRPDDVALLRSIRHLLHDSGYTIRGVQRILRQQGPKSVAAMAMGEVPIPPTIPDDEVEEDASGALAITGSDGFGTGRPLFPSGTIQFTNDQVANALVATLLHCATTLAQARTANVPIRLVRHRDEGAEPAPADDPVASASMDDRVEGEPEAGTASG